MANVSFPDVIQENRVANGALEPSLALIVDQPFCYREYEEKEGEIKSSVSIFQPCLNGIPHFIDSIIKFIFQVPLIASILGTSISEHLCY